MEETQRLVDTMGYWQRYADAFVAPLRANGQLNGFITNPAVTGAYAEAWLRSLIGSQLTTLRMSTGAIIRTSDEIHGRDLRSLPQSDLIIWDPSELPPLFATGDFALIHAQSARAIVEIKRTIGTAASTQQQLKKQRQRLLSPYRRNVLGVVISAPVPLHEIQVSPDWVTRIDPNGAVPLVRLLGGDQPTADADGIFALIYFLNHVMREHARELLPNQRL